MLILGVLFFKEPIKLKTWIGIGLAMAGTFILMGSPNSIQNPLVFVLMLASGLFWAIYSVELKKYLAKRRRCGQIRHNTTTEIKTNIIKRMFLNRDLIKGKSIKQRAEKIHVELSKLPNMSDQDLERFCEFCF